MSSPTQNIITGKNLLSRAECSALRGFAILGIFMHNYLHWLRPMVKENEYQFHEANVDRMTLMLAEPSWDIVLQLFSFFGHYGVPVFLFLSGYGLVLKYEGKDAMPGIADFCRHHFMKLFPMMMLGFSIFAMVDWITPGRHHWAWSDIIAQMTMTINLFAEPDKIIWPGPYWFFGLMMQLYIVYRLLIYNKSNKWLYGLMGVCWALQALCFPEPEGEIINRLRYNCIGGMVPFGMGIALARLKQLPQLTVERASALFIISIVAIASFSLHFQAWLWVPMFIVSMHIAMVKLLPAIVLKGLEWLGVLSAAIFVCHPITRKIFIPISRGGDIMDGLLIYIVTTLMLAMLFKMVIDHISLNKKRK